MGRESEYTRLFAAINFSPGICSRLLALQSELRAKSKLLTDLVARSECGGAGDAESPACQNSVTCAANFVNNPRQLRGTGGVLRGYWIPPQRCVDFVNTPKSRSGNFTAPENIHLTLVFLGECSGEQLAAAKAAMDAVRFEPFYIEIDRVGRFVRGDGNIYWAGVRESRPLFDLQRMLSGKLASKGFEIDGRKYSPHITLGRKVVASTAGWGIEPFGEMVSSIELMKSERVQGRLTYTAIHRKGAQTG